MIPIFLLVDYAVDIVKLFRYGWNLIYTVEKISTGK